MQIKELIEKIDGLKGIIETYEMVGRGECKNCINGKKMLKDYESDLKELRGEEERIKNVVQEIEGGNVNLGRDPRVLQTTAGEILSTSV